MGGWGWQVGVRVRQQQHSFRALKPFVSIVRTIYSCLNLGYSLVLLMLLHSL